MGLGRVVPLPPSVEVLASVSPLREGGGSLLLVVVLLVLVAIGWSEVVRWGSHGQRQLWGHSWPLALVGEHAGRG